VALKSTDTTAIKPEERELARKVLEQTTLETELTERELRTANLRAELGAFERRYLHFVGSRYAELDDLKAQIANNWRPSSPEMIERNKRRATPVRARMKQSLPPASAPRRPRALSKRRPR